MLPAIVKEIQKVHPGLHLLGDASVRYERNPQDVSKICSVNGTFSQSSRQKVLLHPLSDVCAQYHMIV